MLVLSANAFALIASFLIACGCHWAASTSQHKAAGTASLPWFNTRSESKNAITSISVTRNVGGLWCVRFDDARQYLADVHVHMPSRAQRIIDELRQREYTVSDQKAGQPVTCLPKRWQAT